MTTKYGRFLSREESPKRTISPFEYRRPSLSSSSSPSTNYRRTNLPPFSPSSSSSSSSRFQKRVSRFLPQNSSALTSKPPPSFGISYSNYKTSADYKSPSSIDKPHSRYVPQATSHYTPNVRQLTSRSTSPGMVNVIQNDESISSMLFLSLPVTDTVRKRQVKNETTQCDYEDCSSTVVENSSNGEAIKTSASLPKQSGFVPKRRSFQTNKNLTNDKTDHTFGNEINRQKSNQNNDYPDDIYLPKQSSFVDRKVKETIDLSKKPVNSSLNMEESLQKVRDWKEKQQQIIKLRKQQMPEYKDDDDDEEWRKKNIVKKDVIKNDTKVIEKQTATNGFIENSAKNRFPTKQPTNETSPKTHVSNLSPEANVQISLNAEEKVKKNTIYDSTNNIKNNYYKNDNKSQTSNDTLKTQATVLMQRKDSIPNLLNFLNNKEGAFIGGLKDIDNLLSFIDNETETSFDQELNGNDVQTSSWVDEDYTQSTVDIDDFLDEDPLKKTTEAKNKPKILNRALSNNPFMRQKSQKDDSEITTYEHIEEVEDDIQSEEIEEIVVNLYGKASRNKTLLISDLLGECAFKEGSPRHKRMLMQLKNNPKFSGFENIKEALEFAQIDVVKLEECGWQLYTQLNNLNKSNEEELINLNSFKPQSKSDDDETGINDTDVKMSLKVHAFIELLNERKEMRKMLFSLKKIFKNEPGTIKEFVHSEGLNVLVEIASDNFSNYTYACYILRGIGQLMLQVDGMNGVVSVNNVVQWFYSCLQSNSVQVVKTVLRLLLMFVCHSECNSFLFIQAVNSFSKTKGLEPFSLILDLLSRTLNKEASQWTGTDIYVMLLVNKTMESIPDLDTFYYLVDVLCNLGIEKIFWSKSNYSSGSTEFIEQIKTFETAVKDEDIRQLLKETRQTQTQQEQLEDLGKTRSRLQSKIPFRRSILFRNKEDVLNRELTRRNQTKKNELSKAMRENKKAQDLKEKNKLTLKMKEENEEVIEAPKEAEVIKSKAELKWEEIENAMRQKIKVKKPGENLAGGNTGFSGMSYLRTNSYSGVDTSNNNNKSILKVKEMDFSDLTEVDEINYLNINKNAINSDHKIISPPPLPPPMKISVKTSVANPSVPPLPPLPPQLPPPPPAVRPSSASQSAKTIKLHWKEAAAEFDLPSGRKSETVWGKIKKEIGPVSFDKEEYSKLFHSKTTELKLKESNSSNKKDLKILDAKRSNLINIALTALPPANLSRTAILSMDDTIMGKEAVEKILTNLLPTEEEKTALVEAHLADPNLTLGPAENFLMVISNITEINSRLKLWLFMLDFESVELEICEALDCLRRMMQEVRNCKTFKYALLVLLAVGNCLNSSTASGFTLDFLSKVVDIKDTSKRKPLLYHLIFFVSQSFPAHTDIFSEFEATNALSRTDWDEIESKLQRLEENCKDSWLHIKNIVKHDNSFTLKQKLSARLSDYAERIVTLKTIHKRIMNKFRAFLLEFGYRTNEINDCKVNEFCKNIIDFSLVWRALRSKVLHSVRKKEMEKEKLRKGSNDLLNGADSIKSVDDQDFSSSSNKIKYLFKNKFKSNGSISESESTNVKKPPIFPNSNFNISNTIDNTLVVPKFPRWPSNTSLGNASETESAYDTGDEDLWDAAVRTRNRSMRRPSRERRRGSIGKQSHWRSESRDRELQ